MKKVSQPQLKLTLEERLPEQIKGAIPDWQLIAMTHYEYARCNKFMVQAVNTIRQQLLLKDNQSNASGPYFILANYLARQFPEFPKTPWGKIAPHIRLERLNQIDINEENGLYEAPTPAWKYWAFTELQIVEEEENTTGIASEKFGVFKIDFGQDDLVIERQFSDWLKSRRVVLQNKYDSTGKLAPGITSNNNYRFHARRPENRERGGGAPPNQYRLALTALGNLRAFVHAKRDADIANKLADKKDLSAWHKYEFYAGRMMICMCSAWRCGARITDVFDEEYFKHNVGFVHFKSPPNSLSDARKGKVEGVREFLSENFIITELNYESATK